MASPKIGPVNTCGYDRMRATLKFDLARWGAKEWAMTALALVVLCTLLLTATRGLALGADGDVLRVRFGGDAQRTRVVIDLDASTRGTLVEAGGSEIGRASCRERV